MNGLPAGKVVVLGGAGFIGANLVRRLVTAGHQVDAVDVQWPDWRIRAITGARPYHLDLRDAEDARLAVRGASTVFHLAADMGGVGWFHSDRDWGSALTNGRITNNVLGAAVDEGVGRLVYASSACALAVEGGRDRPLREVDLTWGTPDARYGWEKRYGAILCQQAPPSLDARVALLHTVYGPLQEHEGQRMKFPAAVATKALRARQTGRLEMWGDGEQTRTYLYADDAVDRLIALAVHPEDPGPIQIGAEGPGVTCNEIARLCLRLAGADGAEIVHVDGPQGVRDREPDLTRWREVFGEPTAVGYEEGFGQMVEWLDRLGAQAGVGERAA